MSAPVIRGCSHFLALGVVAFSTALPSVALAKAGELTIAHVFTGWREAASFKRISEYFDGRENTGGQQVVRTHPDQRAGYYFVVRTTGTAAPGPVTIKLQFITAAKAAPQTHAFAADLKAGNNVLNLGLTGADWPDAKANPVAWKLEIVATDGRVLATEESYLWEKPATG